MVSRDCLFKIEDVYVKHINLKNKYELTVIFHWINQIYIKKGVVHRYAGFLSNVERTFKYS